MRSGNKKGETGRKETERGLREKEVRPVTVAWLAFGHLDVYQRDLVFLGSHRKRCLSLPACHLLNISHVPTNTHTRFPLSHQNTLQFSLKASPSKGLCGILSWRGVLSARVKLYAMHCVHTESLCDGSEFTVRVRLSLSKKTMRVSTIVCVNSGRFDGKWRQHEHTPHIPTAWPPVLHLHIISVCFSFRLSLGSLSL